MADVNTTQTRKRKSASKSACLPCYKSKIRCSGNVPCESCYRRGLSSRCTTRREPGEAFEPKRRIKIAKNACDRCKLSKSRCDELPICSRCEKQGVPCVRRPRSKKPETDSDESQVVMAVAVESPELSFSSQIQVVEMPSLSLCSNLLAPTETSFKREYIHMNFLRVLESSSPLDIKEWFLSEKLSTFAVMALRYMNRAQITEILQTMRGAALQVLSCTCPELDLQRLLPPMDNPFGGMVVETPTSAFHGKYEETESLSERKLLLDSYSFDAIFALNEINVQSRPIAKLMLQMKFDATSMVKVKVNVTLNSFAEEIFGCSTEKFTELLTPQPNQSVDPEEFLVAPTFSLFHPEDWAKIPVQTLLTVFTGPSIQLIRIRTRSGDIIPCYQGVAMDCDEFGRPLSFLVGYVPLNAHEIPTM